MAPRTRKNIRIKLKEITPVVMCQKIDQTIGKQKFKDMAIRTRTQKWLDNYYVKAEEIGKEIKEANGDQTYLTVLASSGQFWYSLKVV